MEKTKSLDELIIEFRTLCLKIFPKATTMSSLEKLKAELTELEKGLWEGNVPDHEIAEEYVDCIMCLIDSSCRAGITHEEFCASFSRKLIKNKNRKWIHNTNNNTYQHADERSCRICGCTDDDCRQCIEKTGSPCHWVEEDLCSACVEPKNK
jgi:hypothetical protein